MAAPRFSRMTLDPGMALALVEELFGQRTAGLALVDRTLRYVAVNERIAEMNGLDAPAHLGRSLRDVLPAPAVPALEALLEGVLAGEPVDDLQVLVPELDDREFRISALPVRSGDEVVAVLTVVIEITDARRAEEALRHSEQRLQVALEGTRTGTFEWNADTGDVRWSPSMGTLFGRGRDWSPGSYDEFVALVHPDDRPGLRDLVGRAVRESAGYEHDYRVILPTGEVRWISSRVHVFAGPGGDPPTLVGLATDVTARRTREHGLRLLADASLVLAESLEPAATLRRIAELAVPELADWCAVHLVDERNEIEQVAVAHGDPDKVRFAQELQQRYPPDRSAPTGVPQVVRSGRAELYPEIPAELIEAQTVDEEHLRLVRELQLHSAMVVPLIARGRTIGALTFVFAESRREYTTELLELAEELGRRAGLAVDNARLHAAERRANARLRELQAVTDLGLAHLDVDDLLRELLHRVVELTNADIGVVLLLDEEERVLRTRATLGLDPAITTSARIPFGEGIAGRIAATRRPLIVEDVPQAKPVSRHLQEHAASLAGVPLFDGDHVIGVMHVSTRTPRRFTESEVELLELVADRAARAIAHARLYEQASSVAVTLQRSLLPAALPRIADLELAVRYVPGQEGTEVGGDWYDVFPLGEECWAVVVGDVVGRGVAAAATMGQLRASLRAYAIEHSDPADALMQLDRLALTLQQVPFATLAMLSIAPADGAGRISVAGHPLPVVRAADGTARLLALRPGPPLALDATGRTAHRVELAPGETLLLYTDGLVERRDRSLDARFAQLVDAVASAPAGLEGLLDHLLERMLGGRTGRDDVALVAIRRPEAP